MPQCADTVTFHRTHAKRMDGIHQRLIMHSQKNSQLDLFQFRTAKHQAKFLISVLYKTLKGAVCCMQHGQTSCRIQMIMILKILRDMQIHKHFPMKKAQYRRPMSKKIALCGFNTDFHNFKESNVQNLCFLRDWNLCRIFLTVLKTTV